MAGLLNKTRLVVALLAIVALVLGTLIYRDIFVPTRSTGNALNLYTVGRRTVTASVTGSGNLVPQAQTNVGFKVAGQLTQILVHVGDHVSTGETLAMIDSTAEQNALAQAQANLAMAQANLQSAETPLTANQVAQLQNAVTTAQQSYNDAVAQVNLTNSQDAAQVTADQNQLAIDQQSLTFNATYQSDVQKLNTDKAALQTALTQFNTDGCQAYSYPFTSPPAPAACLNDFNTVSTDQATVNSDQLAVNTLAAAVDADQAKLNADLAKQQTDKVSGQRSINQAAAALTSAQDSLKTQTEAKPNQIAAARANLLSAQAAVQTAQQNLDDTTLSAPIDGTVDSINGVVGEAVAPGGGTTAQAPGSEAPLPSTSSAGGAGSAAFMVISNIAAMQVVIPFAESDASRIAFNQDAQITFDAVPNLTVSGHVIAVASAATVSSGVVNYYATITLNQTNPALKEGMTANATVTVSKVTGVLTVPNLAISHSGGQPTVLVYSDGQQVATPIETGVVGDQFTEITGGLNDGEQIVLPTVRAATGSGTTRGGFGGGGGVRIGAGG